MKLRRSIATLAIAVLLAAAGFAQEKSESKAGGAPKLSIESTTRDFGEIKSGTPLRHSFKIKNEGTADLEIKSVAPSCGCTASSFDKVIAPGKEGSITLAIEHTENYSGEIAKSAHVTTNDPAKPSFNLVLRALFKMEAKPGEKAKATAPEGKRVGAFTISPSDRWFGAAISGTSARTVMYLLNKEGAPVHIKRVIPGGKGFNVAVQPIEDGKRYELLAVSDPGLKPGQYVQDVKLMTDNAAAPEVAVRLELTVYPKVMVSPTSIVIPTLPTSIDLGGLAIPKVYIRKPREGGLKVNKIASSLDFVATTLNTQKEGEFYIVDLKLDSSKIKPGEYEGKIRIETNDAESPVIEVPIKCSFTK